MSQIPEKSSKEHVALGDVERTRDLQTVASTPSPPHNGGVHAWFVALGAFCALICTFGYLNSFGLPVLLSFTFAQTPISLRYFMDRLAAGLPALSGRPSLWTTWGSIWYQGCLIPASTALVFSVMMTSLAIAYYQFILVQGIVEGLSCGMIFTPTVSTVGQCFTTKRAWAMGVVVSGASIGGAIFPIALNSLFNYPPIGFGWTLRVVGFIMLALLTFACVVMTEHAPRRRQKFWLPEAFKSGPYSYLPGSAILGLGLASSKCLLLTQFQ